MVKIFTSLFAIALFCPPVFALDQTDQEALKNTQALLGSAERMEALKDPNAFMNGLPPEQQKRIRELASEIDKQNAANKK